MREKARELAAPKRQKKRVMCGLSEERRSMTRWIEQNYERYRDYLTEERERRLLISLILGRRRSARSGETDYVYVYYICHCIAIYHSDKNYDG